VRTKDGKTMKSQLLVAALVGLAGISGCATSASDDVSSASDQFLSAPCGGDSTVHGAIEAKYSSLGGSASFLGCPTNSETPTPTKFGAFNTFQNGAIYWSPATGAHELHGAIRDAWGASGWENGPLGFPTSDESPGRCLGVRYNTFENGEIVWTPLIGARTNYGPVRDVWARNDFECGRFGVPWSDIFYTPVAQRIQINAVQSFDTQGEAYWQIFTQRNGRTAAIIVQNINGQWHGTCSLGLLSWFPC
jgi:uncharacterized protein with LGFP repeats